jgi:hypothetical protein
MLGPAAGLGGVQISLADRLPPPVIGLSLLQPNLALDSTGLTPRFLLRQPDPSPPPSIRQFLIGAREQPAWARCAAPVSVRHLPDHTFRPACP